MMASGFKEGEMIDTTGTKPIEASKSSVGSLGGSDLAAFLESKVLDFQKPAHLAEKQPQKASPDTKKEPVLFDKPS